MKTNITFFIFTYNEENRIELPIRCYRPYGNVVIVDNYSKDKTVAIAKKLGAKVIFYKNQDGVPETKGESDFIHNRVKTDWVFWGFCDEMVPKTCLELYVKIANENKYKIVVQNRKTMMFDPKSDIVPGFINIKFFRKDSVDFTHVKIHKTPEFKKHVKPGEVLYLPPLDEYSVYHYSPDMTEDLISKINRYTNIQVLHDMDFKVPSHKVVTMPFIIFITHYFFLGAWKFGINGFIVSMRFALGAFVLYSKKYEIDNNITRESIEKKFTEGKKKLLTKSPHSNVFLKVWSRIVIFFLERLHRRYTFPQQSR